MECVKIVWEHHHKDEPVVFYLELDKDRYNTRKIEVFRNGQIGFACDNIEVGGARLVEGPFPSIEEENELNKGNDWGETVVTYQISHEEFELLWKGKGSKISTESKIDELPG